MASGSPDIDPIIAAVNAQTNERWAVAHRFAGGSNGGAYLVRNRGGGKLVLKVQLSDPGRILSADKSVPTYQRTLAAASMVAIARERGWPTPAWHGVGLAPTGETWILQEFVEGAQPPVIDGRVADLMIEIFEVQAGLLPARLGGWSEWISRALFEDGEGLRGRIHTLSDGAQIVRSVDAIAERFTGVAISSDDLVHGDLNLTNMLFTPQGLSIIDVDTLDSGPRAYDVIKTLIVASILDQATEAGSDRLWSYAEKTFDGREFALCSGAAALTITESIVRHDLQAEARTILPKISMFLNRVQALPML